MAKLLYKFCFIFKRKKIGGFIMVDKELNIFTIIDNTFRKLGLPAPGDIIPTPDEVLEILGLPSLGEISSGIKEKIKDKAKRL